METNLTLIDEVIGHHGTSREALVEILRELSQQSGYLTTEAMEAVAARLQLPPSEVHSVASFYSMINVEQLGEHVIKLCQDAPCHVAGGREIWETLERELGIQFGETTADGNWTLLPTSCLGLCAVGPVMLVDEEAYGNLTPAKVKSILNRYRTGGEA
ncbi:MAG: NADH-quinone oxidoreductase subunit NuoE [Chloroflexota bacterium]|nr:NADH-quinone oxidoreductase subunit NuoE [Chloroflexota bacterium]